MNDKPKTTYVGSCQHDIDEQWYLSDDSTYLVLDEPTGVVTNVTTCMECKADNAALGLICDVDDLPVDNFVNPFADDPAPDLMCTFDADGNAHWIDLTEEY